MKPLANAKHEIFCQELLKNKGHQTKAYMEVYPRAKPESARHGGSYLLRNVDIRSRVNELMEAQGLGLMDLMKKLHALTQSIKFLKVNGYLQSAPDNATRLEAIRIALRIHGLLGNKADIIEAYLSSEQLAQLDKVTEKND
jgi:hypothetical protein